MMKRAISLTLRAALGAASIFAANEPQVALATPGQFPSSFIDWTGFSPLTAGSGVTITGTWPNQTIAASGTLSGPITVPSVNGLVFNFDPTPFISTPPGTGPNVDNVYLGTPNPTMSGLGGNIVSVGYGVLPVVSTGYSLAFGGYNSGHLLTTGYEDTAWGDHALASCVNCTLSTAVGQAAFNYAVSSISDTGLGWGAGYIDLASYETAVGSGALLYHTGDPSTGEQVAVGESAGRFSNGRQDVFVGRYAGQGALPSAVAITGGSCTSTTATLTGSWGTYGVGAVIYVQSVIGATGLNANSASPGSGVFGGWSVTASSAGSVSFTVPNCGASYTWSGSDGGTLYANTYFDQGDVGIGYESLYSLQIVAGLGYGYNTAVGLASGYGITTGAGNILIGASPSSASYNQVTTGATNISIGYNVALPSATASNQLDIGNFLYCTGLSGTGASISPGLCGVGLNNSANPWTVQQNAVTTPGTASTYGYMLDVGSAVNSLGLGADTSYAYIQSFNGKPLWLNPAGNNVLTSGFAIASLPTCNSASKGAFSYVTNGQTTPTFLGTVSTTGTVIAPVFCNGTGWIYGMLDEITNDNDFARVEAA